MWTFPADADLRVGLVSHGLSTDFPQEPATSQFDYFRVYAG